MERLTEWMIDFESGTAIAIADGPYEICSGYCKMIDRLAAYEDTGLTPEEVARLVNPWISVEERLPESDDNVLCGAEFYTAHEVHYNSERKTWMCWDELRQRHFPIDYVAYWMPIPSIPQKGA